MKHVRTPTFKTAGVLLAGALVLTACGSDADTTDEDTAAATAGDETAADETAGDETAADETAGDEATDAGDTEAGGEGGTVNAATIGWTEDVAVNALWTELLAERGYEWTSTPAEVGAIYQGMADGDFDLFMDAWLPGTHEDYWDQFGDQLDDMTTWYDQAPLYWTVPTAVAEEHDITSIADLKDKADLFDGTITGIDSGAGIMRLSKESVIPTYDLGDGYTVQDSSTSAMLTELGSAVDAGDPIVVTLWEPHSAYAKWDLTNLEDPENAFGDPDEIRIVTREGFSDDMPEVAGWLSNFSISSDALSDLELKIEEAGEGNTADAVQTWIDNNQDVVTPWFE